MKGRAPAASAAHCPSPPAPPPCSSPAAAGCSAAAPGCSRRPWTGCLLCSTSDRQCEKGGITTGPGIFTLKTPHPHPHAALTAPVLLSTLQSGMIFESVTIQLLILSLLLLSTAEKNVLKEKFQTTKHLQQRRDYFKNGNSPSLCCALRLSSLGARGPSTFLQRHSGAKFNVTDENRLLHTT